MSPAERLLRWLVRPSAPAPARTDARPRRRPASTIGGRTAPASLLGAVAAWLVRPPDAAALGAGERRFAPPVAEQPRVAWHGEDRATLGVLADAATAYALGACAGLGAAARGVALLCVWRARVPASGGAPAAPAARRLCGALRSRGLAARAVGRLVVAELSDDPVAARAEVARAEAVAGPAARVLALGGARGEEWDEALGERDAVLVHGRDRAVVELAVGRLVERGAPARAFAPPPSRVARRLAGMGLLPPRSATPAALGWQRRP